MVKLGEAEVEVVVDLGKLRAGLERARKATVRAAGSMSKAFKSVLPSIKRLGLALGATAIAAGVASIKMANDFNAALQKIVALTSTTQEEVDSLRGAILDLAKEIGKSPIELAEALFPIASAGARGAEALDVLRASAMASATGIGTVEDAAFAVNKILANFSDEVDGAAGALGVLIATTEKADAPTEAIAKAFADFLPIASDLGIELREAAGAFAFLTLTQRSAEKASVGLIGLLTKLQLPPQELKSVLEELGVGVDALGETLGSRGIAATIKQLADALGKGSELFKRFFGDREALNAANILLKGTQERVVELNDIMNSLARSGVPNLAKAFDDINRGGSRDFEKLIATINVSFIKLGDVLLPRVIPLVQDFTTALSNNADEIADTARDLLNLAVALAAGSVEFAKFFGIIERSETEQILRGINDAIERAQERLEALEAGGFRGLIAGTIFKRDAKEIEEVTRLLVDLEAQQAQVLGRAPQFIRAPEGALVPIPETPEIPERPERRVPIAELVISPPRVQPAFPEEERREFEAALERINIQFLRTTGKIKEAIQAESKLAIEALEEQGRAGLATAERVAAGVAQLTEIADQRIKDLIKTQDKAAESARAIGVALETAFQDAIFRANSFGDVLSALARKLASLVLFGPSGGGGLFGGGIASLAASVSGAIGGSAGGGRIQPNIPRLVGERGPELIVSNRSASVINNAGTRALGGGMSLSIAIDARGSGDPAAVEAAVGRGIVAAIPTITAAAQRRTIAGLSRPRVPV